uniref:GATA zinc finger domain-containing protein 1 n=1 Tax=Strigamia maritima TaxID=126957 RepID=T1J4H0_STRMM
MPFGVKHQCASCNSDVSAIWRKNEKGEVLCNSCLIKCQTANTTTNADTSIVPKKENGNSSNGNTIVLRKSTRTRSHKHKVQSQNKSGSLKGKGRRIIFKKSATKAPTAVATPVTTDCVFHKGTYFKIGDIVSLMDMSGDIYFAQVRGLLQDQFCEKSAVITWLLPTMYSARTDQFDPSSYILGPEEDLPRKLDCMEFVCHAPSEYFRSNDSPYATKSSKPDMCFIWTRIGPQIKPMPNSDDIYNV